MPKLKDNFTNILNKLITDKNISKAEFRILCYLLMRAGNQDVCYPSLNTIAADTDIGLSTVKCLIYTEPTEVILKNGKKQNRNLKYTIRPIQDAVEYFHQQQMKKFQEDLACENAKRMLEEYDRKHPRESA